MKISFIAALLGTFITFNPEADANDWKGTFHTGIISKYLAKPGFTVHNKPIWVNDISLTYKKDWYAGIWTSAGLFDGELGRDYGEEIDLYAGLNRRIGAVDLGLRLQWFMINDINGFGKTNNDLWIFDGSLRFASVPHVTPYLEVRYFGEVGKRSPKSGWLIWPGARRNQRIPIRLFGNSELALNLDAKLGISSGGAFHGKDGILYIQFGASTDIRLDERTFLSPSLLLHIPTGGTPQIGSANVTKPQLVWGAMLRFEF